MAYIHVLQENPFCMCVMLWAMGFVCQFAFVLCLASTASTKEEASIEIPGCVRGSLNNHKFVGVATGEVCERIRRRRCTSAIMYWTAQATTGSSWRSRRERRGAGPWQPWRRPITTSSTCVGSRSAPTAPTSSCGFISAWAAQADSCVGGYSVTTRVVRLGLVPRRAARSAYICWESPF